MKIIKIAPNISTISVEANVSVVDSDPPVIVVSELPQTSVYSSVERGGKSREEILSYWLWGDGEVILWGDGQEIEQ